MKRSLDATRSSYPFTRYRWREERISQGDGIVKRQAARATKSAEHAALAGGARAHEKQVGAKRLQPGGDDLLRSSADRHERDDGGDADHDSQHRQARSEAVRAQRSESRPKYRQGTHPLVSRTAAISASARRGFGIGSSLTTRPSSMETTRGLYAAMSAS